MPVCLIGNLQKIGRQFTKARLKCASWKRPWRTHSDASRSIGVASWRNIAESSRKSAPTRLQLQAITPPTALLARAAKTPAFSCNFNPILMYIISGTNQTISGRVVAFTPEPLGHCLLSLFGVHLAFRLAERARLGFKTVCSLSECSENCFSLRPCCRR